MNLLQTFTMALCIAGFAAAVSTPSAAAPDDVRFAAAMHLYRDGHYSLAHDHLVELADGGHAEAARIALLMVRFGPQLYGDRWSASATQIERWIELAARNHWSFVADDRN